MPELYNQAAYSQTSELQGYTTHSQTRHEAYKQQVHEAPGQYGPPGSNAHGPPMSELQGMGWQSGPVANAYEMDAGHGGPQSPHVR
jgi:hypothetical protein